MSKAQRENMTKIELAHYYLETEMRDTFRIYVADKAIVDFKARGGRGSGVPAWTIAAGGNARGIETLELAKARLRQLKRGPHAKSSYWAIVRVSQTHEQQEVTTEPVPEIETSAELEVLSMTESPEVLAVIA